MKTKNILSILFLGSIIVACQDKINERAEGDGIGIENWMPDTFVGTMTTATSESTTRMTIDGKYSIYSVLWESK